MSGKVAPARLLRRFPVYVWQWLILAGGVALRLLFFARDGWVPVLRAESTLIAISIAQNGTFANPYGGETGPTAHLMPLYPLWQALLIRIFGTGPEARFAIAFFSSLAACLGFALFPKLSERAGLGPYAGVLGGLMGAFLPLNFFPQTEGGFETSFVFLAIVLLLLLWMKIWSDGKLGWPRAVACGAAMGAAGLLSTVLLPVMAVWLLLPMVVRILPVGRRGDWLRFAILACATAGVLYAPWVIRNKLALGKPILTRSNFGLEMYKDNSDISPPTMDVAVEMPEYQARGPYGSDSERARVKAMGEVAYNAEKLRLAEEWIRVHPRRFLVLTLERIWYSWFPSMARPWQTTGEAVVTILGLWGLFSLGWRGRTRNLPLMSLVVFAVYPLVYYVTISSWRYRFPFEGLLIFWMGTWLTCMSRTDVMPSGDLG